jgi:hypothetical protein
MQEPDDTTSKLLMDGSAREILEVLVRDRDNIGSVKQYALAVRLTQDLTASIDRASKSSNKIQWGLVIVGSGMWVYTIFEAAKLWFLNQ